MHSINKETKMIMLDKSGVKWFTDLRSETSGGDRIRLIGGWKDFFKANCVEIGESIIVKLIWEGDKSCVLEFYSKDLISDIGYFLPVNITRMNGINKETKMIMLDKNGVKWFTDLRPERSGGDRIRLIGG
ncbi:unnamed protein product [Eruca vesicaria subsp. sativa]|uniref:TF-B3 domain-containing protein n=1 Tax=Eruca vesicaria subsp. sativa TaxID=29727 RepID=A0ABC8KY81_ERUVS|nr:unnamed protein product [Eruca vesicaria subsp. sativa]